MAVEVLHHVETVADKTPNVLAQGFVKLLEVAKPFLVLAVAAFVFSRVLKRNNNKKA